MAASVSLGTIRQRAQSLADAAQGLASTTEWNFWINAAAADLYDRLTQADPERYVNTFQFSLVPPAIDVALPADFYKLLRVDCIYGQAGQNPPLFYTVRKFSLLEEDAYQYPVYVTLAGPAYRYRLRGNNIHFTPAPNASTTMRILYVPVITPLVNDSDTMDGINGWEEFVVISTAIRALQKENATDTTSLVQEREKWESKIKALELERDSSFPEQTIDVMRGPFPYRGWPGGGFGS